MRNVVRSAAAVALCLSLPLVAHAAPTAPAATGAGTHSVDEIIAKNIAARGGLAKLRAIQSTRVFARVRLGFGDGTLDADFNEEYKRGVGYRSELTIQGLVGVDGYDGKDGWATEPWEGRKDAVKRGADETKLMAEAADFDGPLVDYQTKGNKVEYLGTEDIDGTKAHKLRVSLKDGNVEYHYLDPDAFLEIRIVKESKVRGAERISETDLGAYEQVAGVWMPLSIETGGKGQPRSFRVTITSLEINAKVDDGDFHFPAPGTKVARAITPGTPTPHSAANPPAIATTAPVFDSSVVSGLGIRNIGSAQMSGRISAVAAFNENGKTTVYIGSASGGVWKSEDDGTTFKPVFDKQPVQSIGALAIDPSNHRTLWAGSGESWTRNSVSIGDGIYKSTDAGATWHNVGLPNSERITRILVHPSDGNTVYACVPGKLWSDSLDRGVYKTTDGGKTWTQVLKAANLSTGCSGLAMDPKNPDVLFAGTWDFRRKGWTFRSGGEGPDAPSGSALYKTSDGGKSWTKLAPEKNKGIPAAPWGRVEVAIAPTDANVMYALIESKDSALYVSQDGGQTWEQRDKSQPMVWRPFYFAHLVVDPTDKNRVFKAGGSLIVSEDGGRSFSPTGGGGHGDWHDIWIDPSSTKHCIAGDDGGLWISHDGGSRWWKSQNLPVSQFYHVSVDAKDPYRVYGGLQDNQSWVAESSYPGGVTNSRWENLFYGDGFYVVVDPTDPNAVYAESQGGAVGRVDRSTRAVRTVQPLAGFKEKLRFNWNAPIHASPTQKGTIYIGAQFLFRSKDRGDSWERISPDLTSNDPQKQKQEQSGGITVDNSAAEMHTTIYAIAESPKDAQTVWVGTDDGNVQITRDGGQRWTNVTANVPGLPKASWVSSIEASRFDAGTAYATFDRHTFGDMTPWVYKTTDFGKSWTRVVSPEKAVRGYAHVVREDSVDPRILYLGTEMGLFISIDGGARWAEFKGGDFPSVAVRDLALQPRDNDLVIATHGRGIWIIDDVSPLRAMSNDTLAKPATFLAGRPVQERMQGVGGGPLGDAEFVGQNAPGGAVITYYQRARHLFGPMKLEILDAAGKVIDTANPTKQRGINRVTWSMQTPAPRVPRAVQLAFSASQGPRVLPGTYTLRLTKGTETIETKLEIGLDRRAPYSVDDRKAQYEATLRAGALFGDMSGMVEKIDAARAGVEARSKSLGDKDALALKLHALDKKLEAAKMKIVATKEGGAITGEERLREHLDHLYGALNGWEGRPAKYQLERIDVLHRELDEVSKELEGIMSNDLRAADAELKSRGLAPIPTAVAASDEAVSGAVATSVARCALQRGQACDDAARIIARDRAAARERD